MKNLTRQAQRVVTLVGFALLLGVCASAAPAKELNGYYEADNGGAHFIRQIGAKVYWFGEDRNGAWANVLMGTISGNKITARFWDVPKGKTKGMGEITLEIQGDGATLVKVSSTTPFGTKTLKKTVPHPEVVNGIPVIKGIPPEMRSRPQGFFEGEQSLTGAWQGDDAAFYYVRQTPTDIVWVAENNQWGGPGGYAQPSFVHVFVGKKINQLIIGDWVDLPKGKASGNGSFAAKLINQQEMNVNPSSAGINVNKIWRSLPNSLRGFADLHAHPMVNLGFAGKLVHGGVDVGSLLPADSKCRPNVRAGSIAEALGTDNSTHGGWGLDNGCGDDLRKAVIDAFQEQNHAKLTPDWALGYPSFKEWPLWNDITHQKMWVDWIRRSYDSGQRVMVALAVNNFTIASGVGGPGDGPMDDKASADLQIAEIKSFVGRHNDFMEVALTPADLRRIVAANKLAIILGVEIDNIGNFNKYGGSGPQTYDEVQHLYNEGVRYAFPIHLINNKFGGTAVYQNVFNLSNYHVTGKFWDLQCAEPADGIKHKFVVDGFDFPLAGAKATKLQVDIARFPPDPPKCGAWGHKNTLGLTPLLGERAIYEMMTRGMLIDIDHMSQLAANKTLDKAEAVPGGYPLVSGHNQMRSASGDPNENNRTAIQLNRIAALGGMFGLGSDGVSAAHYLNDYLTASKRMVIASKGREAGRVAFGTDLNGLVRGPHPAVTVDSFTLEATAKFNQQVKACQGKLYNSSFIMGKTGDKRFDFCEDGVAHYGMLADFLQYISGMDQGADLQTNIMQNAEMFAQMWEKAVKNSKGVPL